MPHCDGITADCSPSAATGPDLDDIFAFSWGTNPANDGGSNEIGDD
jgi:hypothetical protein